MTTTGDMAYEFRAARPEDTKAIEALDGSFTTHTIFQVAITENGFTLQEIPTDPPIHKVFPGENTDDTDAPVTEEGPNSSTFVAVSTNGSLAGFTTVSYASWNRRLSIEDIEVAPAHRRQGIGRALISHALKVAREFGAGHIWLEVSNINTPAIHAYQRMGFTFCGLDTTLYNGSPSSGEQALYMSMPCHEQPANG
ncbi:GNAT family N-acetyltransferase [Streptomyces sp. NPDC015237]|uniref:GNAT family N-acetyltransferase n=1 Tax=unclassified Streptomyces TaxID=2593676 RepID=UPI0036FAE3B5